MKKTMASLSLALLSTSALAYDFKVGEDEASVYASFRMAMLAADGAYSLEDRSSRAGFKYKRKMNDNLKIGLHGEYAINTNKPTKDIFFKGDQFQSINQTGPFSNRLGYISIDDKNYGEVRIGKQWSTFYDVVEPTDYFWAFGGEGSSAYSLSSDGGLLGTGRADSALTYRKSFSDKFSIGAQYQYTGDKEIKTVDDNDNETVVGTIERGYGGNVAYKNGIFNASIGFVRADFKNQGKSLYNEIYAASLNFKTDYQYLALVYTIADGAEFDNNGIIFDSHGFEALYVYWTQPKTLHFYGGTNNLRPVDDSYDARSESKYKLEKYILGAGYKYNKTVFALEGLYDKSKNADGSSTDNSVVAAFIRIDV